MRIHLCGVRGSTPAPGIQFAEVGGNTSSVAIVHGDEDRPRLILDAGTGIRAVDALLGGHPFAGSILLGHLHWDHTHGLPFFRGADRCDASTNLLVPDQGAPAIDLLRRFMSPPSFPIEPTDLQGSWTFASIDEGLHTIEGFEVLARQIPHKGGRTFGYRISDGQSSFAYLSDHGPAGALGPGPDGWGPYHQAALDLCTGVDLLIHDAQHTSEELAAQASYGHSAVDYPVALAERCDVPRVLLFHHAPGRTDADVRAIEAALATANGVEVRAAREGDVISIGASARTLRH
ncbi:MAG: MBL fold metallo-hydrolase [Acidimicrobiia bacterium]